jgi:hypothetical protein
MARKDIWIMRKLLLVILIVNLVLISACTASYMNIPDSKIGKVILPDGWVFEVIDNWIYIKDNESTVVGIQRNHGDYWNVGQEIHDERVVNPLFEDYLRVELIQVWGGSNGSYVNLSNYQVNNEIKAIYFIGFDSYTHDRYEISIFMFDVPLETLISISESYKPFR